MNVWLLAAAAASLATMLIHLIAGGREIARPLLAADGLPPVPKFTLYYCWHLVTITIAALAAGFAYAGLDGARTDLAVAATAVAMLFALWNGVMIAVFRLRVMRYPQWILFAVIAVFGLAGLVP